MLQQILMIKSQNTVICYAHKRLKDAATRCVLRPIDASNAFAAGAVLPPCSIAGFGETGMVKGEWKPAGEGKGTEGKETKGKEM